MRYFLPVLILRPHRYVSTSTSLQLSTPALTAYHLSIASFCLGDDTVESALSTRLQNTIDRIPPRVAFALDFATKRATTKPLQARVCEVLSDLGYLLESGYELHAVYKDAIHRFIEIGESADSDVSVAAIYGAKVAEYPSVSVIEGADDTDPAGFRAGLIFFPPAVHNAFRMAAESSNNPGAWQRTVDVIYSLYKNYLVSTGDEVPPAYGVIMEQFIRVTALNLYLARVESIPSVHVIRETGETGLPGFAKLLADMPIDIVLAFVLKTQTCLEEHCWRQIIKTLFSLLTSSYKKERGDRRELKPITEIEPELNQAITELAS